MRAGGDPIVAGLVGGGGEGVAVRTDREPRWDVCRAGIERGTHLAPAARVEQRDGAAAASDSDRLAVGADRNRILGASPGIGTTDPIGLMRFPS